MIRIITDTSSDITPREAALLQVELVRVGVHFGEAPYDAPGDDFAPFYSLLAACKELPTTSQPPPSAYLTLFEAAKKAGEEVVVIALSGNLSGTVQSAFIAKEMADYPPVYIVDSLQTIMGLRLLVELAVKLRGEKKSAAEIAAAVEEAKGRVCLFGALDTLKYLRKGGRIPKTTEVLGSMMNIKPIVQLTGGRVVMAGKARGHAGAVTTMVRKMEEHLPQDDAMPVYFGYTATEPYCRHFAKLVCAKFRLDNIRVCAVGPILGTHIGPDAFGFVFLEKGK